MHFNILILFLLLLGERFRRSRNYGNREIGEIFKEYSHIKYFYLKIFNLDSSLPAGYLIHEQITFANAIWILKIYPYFRMENSNRRSFDMVLERLQTEIPEHHVFLEIDTSIYDLHNNTFSDTQIVEKSFFFNAYLTQGEVITFQLKKDYPEEIVYLYFTINMRSKKYTGMLESDFDSKSTKQVISKYRWFFFFFFFFRNLLMCSYYSFLRYKI